MSDYGLFEADEVAANEPRRQARTAARHLDAAINEVRKGFGRFLLGATGIDEFEDRWHLSKADIRSTVEPHVFPNTGTMRRIQNAMKADWKVAHPYKLAEDRDAPIQDIDETFSPDSGNLIPEGNFQAYEDSVDQGGPEKVQNAFTPGDREARRRVAGGEEMHGDGGPWQSPGPYVGGNPGNGPDPDPWDPVEYDDDDDKWDAVPVEGNGNGRLFQHRDREAARLVADIYTDFARSNGMRVASLDTLDRYASTGIHNADYELLQNLIVAACECDDDEEGGDEKEAPKASESDSDDDSDDDSEAPDFGGESESEGSDEGSEDDDSDEDDSDSDSEGGDEEYDFGGGDSEGGESEGGDDFGGGEGAGGEQFTVPEQAPDLEPQLLNEIPHDDPQGAAPVPPEVIDSLLGLPEGTIEQLLLEEVQQGQGGGDGFGGPPQGGPPPAGPEQGGAPQGGGDDFFGGGGDDTEQEPPRVARRRRVAKDYGRKCSECKSINTDYSSSTNTYDCYDCGATFKPYSNSNSKKSPKKESSFLQARQFWAADGDEQPAEGGGGEQQAAPAQDPAAAGGQPPMDPNAMGGMQQPMLPPPGSQAVAPPAPAMPLENQPAEDALLDTANQAIMQMIDRETQEYQQIIDPLSQALQAVQFAQQVEQSEHPMDVTPPQGTVNVDPSQAPGGAQNPMQPTARRRQAGPYDEGVDALSREMGRKLIDEPAGRNFPTSGDVPWPEDLSHHLHGDPSRSGYDAGFDASWHPSFSGHEDPWQAAGNAWTNAGGPGSGFDDGWQDSAAEIPHRHNNPEGYQEYRSRQARLRKAKVRTALRGAARVIAQKYRLSATGERMLLQAAIDRRGYEHIIEALHLVPVEARKAAAIHMGHLLAAGNARFNRDVFLTAAMSDPRTASNPRDRAGDAWRDGRDRGVAEHGRQDAEEGYYRDESDPNSWEPHNDGYQPGNITGSRGRLPFDGPRLAGETWAETPVKDPFEFPLAGQVVRVDDKNDTNDLPPMPGADPHGKNAARARQAADITRKLQRWMQQQQARGLNYGGDVAAEGFLSQHPKAGPRATQMVHQQVGAESHPEAEVAVPKVKAPKAVNPVTKKGSFFTRKVSGWKWDDHLSGYLSKEARAFTCACGEKVAAPSYKTCKCGKIWNVYAIGDSHHLASDTADVYIAREIPVRDNVIMANKKLVEPAKKSNRELLAEIDKLADWTIYDDEDPSRQGGPKKPPSTKVPTGDAKWHSRNSDGKYLSPATFPPKKK